ncbi:MAG TPA: type II secretion system F family protein [Patescibacteria group bacterium]|nr:type II secretion system F family protein [Patescibacteria group bacterium]
MPTFAFRGVNQFGAVVAGRRAATSREELVSALGRQHVRITKVTEKASRLNMTVFGSSVTVKDIAIFTRQLSVMIDSGLPLMQCLQILAEQQDNKNFQRTIQAVRTSVEGGTTLSAAMEPFPKIFDRLFVNMVAAGEAGGILDRILQRISTYIEKNLKLRRQVKSALIYPVSVIVIAAGVIILLLWKVVPIFAKLFASLNTSLPLPTRIVIDTSHFIGSIWGLLILVGFLLTAGTVAAWYRTPPGRFAIDAFLLRMPLIGLLLRKIAVARFTSTLGTLITSGVPILEGLDITGRTSGNAVIERAIEGVRRAVEAGGSLVAPLRKSAVFPAMVTQMIEVGEQTGAMDTMLQKISEFYEEEVDVAVKNLLAALEPMMIVFLGVVVGGIVISMYLPLFSLIAKLSH